MEAHKPKKQQQTNKVLIYKNDKNTTKVEICK